MSTEKKKNDSFIIVGIGASAGGLAVLKKFVKSLPEKTGMAYIIIQHLDPTHKSMLAELLSKESKMSVEDAEDNQIVRPDHIYVIPPDSYLELQEEVIKLTEPEETRGSRKAIDHFFRTLARERADRCAGIILSGSGGDGTAGLRAIKAVGGLVLAQDPDTADHPSMPNSAIEADVVDKVCAVEEMVDIIFRFSEHPLTQKVQASKDEDEDDEVASAQQSLEEIAVILKTHENFNLNQYKPATIQRRISRRISLTNTAHYKDYLQKVRDDEVERKQLTKDLLINVTDFFRDPEAFDLLEKKVIPDILENIRKKEDIRVWVPGCASGEEAYSLAILLLEALEERKMRNNIKIFATDIDEHAIKTARKGIYSDSIAGEVPKKYLDRYFIKIENDHHYKIKSEVRDLISFAVQNAATDPPFNHMHLISCRNLLIYFNREVQEKVLSAFYFALNDHAYLFLGSSESLGNKADLFKTTSKKWRFYQKIPGQNKRKVMLDHLHIAQDDKNSKGETSKTKPYQRQNTNSRSERMRRSILEKATPPTVLVDEEGRVLFSHGDLDPYLNFPVGEPRYDLAQVVKPAMRSRIRSALYKAKKSHEKLIFHCTIEEAKAKNVKRVIQIEITPVKNPDYTDGNAYAVMFTKVENFANGQKNTLTRDDENTAHAELELELAETREELQNTIEELETSTEELKASHEEALSTNEELQSSNEELEASSEELRSLNEELSTVNAQLKEKIEQLKRANDDVENFFASTNLPTIFLDPELKIQRYTPAAEHLLKMGPRDIDRKIASLGRDLIDEDLTEECKEVLRTFQPINKEIKDYKGRWYIRQLTPYRTEDRRVEGVVLVFQDVTELKELTNRAETRELQQSVVARLGLLALAGAEPEDLMQQAVRQVAYTLDAQYCKVLKYQPEQHNFLLVAGIGWQEGLVGKATVPDDQNSQAGYTLLAHEPVIVEKLNEEKRFSGPELLIEHQITSGISCLINHSDPPYGVLGVHTKDKHIFTKDDANFLVSVANMLSTAIHAREAQERIFASEEKFRTMANSIPQLAWMTDETGYIFWYNQRWYDFTGTSLEEVAGWDWQKVHHPDHVERVVKSFKQNLDNGNQWEDTFPLLSKKGEYRWFLSRAVPIRNQAGKIVRWFGTNTDINDKLEREEALRQSEERLRLAKNSSRLGLFDYDIPNNSIEWEPLLREIWGIDSNEQISVETFFEGLHPDDVENTRKAIEKSTDSQGDGHYEVTYRVIHKKTKDTYWIKAAGTVLFKDKEPKRMIGLVDDVTNQKNLELSLQQAIEQLEETDKKKTEFLSILGHELRNPLASLSISVELLKQKLQGEDKIFRIMTSSVKTMARLLDDLLDLNRISRNLVALKDETVNIKEVLDRVVEGTEHIYTDKNQEVELDIKDNLLIAGDRTRLEQVFTNLLINASKYSPQGGKIKLQTVQEDEKIKVKVSDNGAGLSGDLLEKIFDPFFQIKQEGHSKQGLGIGLALAKKLVELHGGTIEAYSEGINKGATFTVNLVAKKQMDAEGSSKTDRPKLKPGLKVLLIDDNQDLLVTIPRQLEALGCQVETASSGKQGMEKAEIFKPDAMLVDIGLPDMSGHEIAKKIRAQDYKGLLVAFSGYSHKEVREESKLAGFDYHLAKPASTDELAGVLATTSKKIP